MNDHFFSRFFFNSKISFIIYFISRKLLYLDGLQKCNSIDDELISGIDKNVVRRSYRKSDSDVLEKTGLNKFFAAFVTLPPVEMKKVVNFVSFKNNLFSLKF